MTIEAIKLDNNRVVYSSRSMEAVASSTQTSKDGIAAADSSAQTETNVTAISGAVEQIHSHLAGLTNPPQFTVDYLSGIDVMTVRAASTGEVVIQIPGATVVKLAQLIKEGVPMDSFGVLDANA